PRDELSARDPAQADGVGGQLDHSHVCGLPSRATDGHAAYLPRGKTIHNRCNLILTRAGLPPMGTLMRPEPDQFGWSTRFRRRAGRSATTRPARGDAAGAPGAPRRVPLDRAAARKRASAGPAGNWTIRMSAVSHRGQRTAALP